MSSGQVQLDGRDVELLEVVHHGIGGYEVRRGAVAGSPGRALRVEVQRGALARRRGQDESAAMQVMTRFGGHPAVLPVLGAGTTADRSAYVVRPWPDGGDVRAQVPMRTLAWLPPIAAALDHLHERHLLHRDVGPANIVLHGGQVQLAGGRPLASDGDDGPRPAGGAAELSYLAPEVLEATTASRATDVYALAATVYLVVTGRPAFVPPPEASSPTVGVLLAIRDEPADPEPLLRAGLDRRAVDMVLLALSKDPAARPSSATSFAAAVAPGASVPPRRAGGAAVDPQQALATGLERARQGQVEEAGRWLQASSRGGLRAGHDAFASWLARWGDPDAATAWFRPLAEAGDLGAAYNLALSLQALPSAARDAEAVRWLEQVAADGDVDAMNRLGQLHERRRREEYALGWYRRAADAGSSSGMNNLGLLWWRLGLRGEGRRWLRQAAEAGNETAAENLRRLSDQAPRSS